MTEPSESIRPDPRELLYTCAFNKAHFSTQCKQLLASVNCATPSPGFDILVYTSERFYPWIQEFSQTLANLDGRIHFWISKSGKQTVFEGCWARYELFSWAEIGRYRSILYLDADILVMSDPGRVFERFDESEFPVATFAEKDTVKRWHGKGIAQVELAPADRKSYDNLPAINSGQFLIRNC